MSQTLYQKYRPKTFEEVIGQEYIKEILLKSIQSNNIQGTYLFNGPRGTGKTSIAKIFAKAINCDSNDNPLNDNCQYCNYFESTTNYDDVFELDAASNNGVDDIRQIIENVQYQPIHLKRKVYIIDEVHMLSKGAFNALLKTLEEPLENSIFILATTEPGKIPATILSRCQRLDFRRVEDQTMTKHLKNILDKENIKYEEEIFPIITTLSDGCVRDALSILQKLVMATDNLTLKYLQKSLGMLKQEQYKEITNFLLKKDLKNLLPYWKKIYNSGINIENFIVDYQYYLKELIINEDEQFNTKQIIDIIYKINDIEQRAVYTRNLSNLIEVCFMDITNISAQDYAIQFKHSNEQIKEQKEIIKEQITPEETITTITKQVQIDEIIDTQQLPTLNLEDDNYNDIIEEQEEVQKPIPSNKNEQITVVSEEVCYSVLNKATKEARIVCTKEFTKISDELTKNKKHGIAKFFIEGQIKAATNEEIIAVIDTDLVKPYLKRKSELLKNLPNIIDIHIIDNKMWDNVKKIYMQQQQTATPKEQKNVNINTEEENVLKKLEEKLQVKVKTMEE